MLPQAIFTNSELQIRTVKALEGTIVTIKDTILEMLTPKDTMLVRLNETISVNTSASLIVVILDTLIRAFYLHFGSR